MSKIIASAAALLAIGLHAALAQTETVWQGLPSANWNDAVNWSEGIPEPNSRTETGTAVITGGSVVNLVDEADVIGITILNIGDGTLNISNTTVDLRSSYYVDVYYDPEGYPWPSGSGQPDPYPGIRVGTTAGETGYLNISNGAKIAGRVDPYGPLLDTQWANTVSPRFGDQYIDLGTVVGATGHLVIEGAGTEVTAKIAVGSGRQVRDGVTNEWLVQAGGAGTVVIRDQAVTNDGIKVGSFLGTGSLVVEGGATVSGIEIGSQGGYGEALIHDGAVVKNAVVVGNDGYGPVDGITQNGEGHLTVRGENTFLGQAFSDNSDRTGYSAGGVHLTIGGGLSRGYVTIEDGATANLIGLALGHNLTETDADGGEGVLRIRGEGTVVNVLPSYSNVNGSDYLYGTEVHIGRTDNGTVIVEDGATLRVVNIDSEAMADPFTVRQSTFVLGTSKRAADSFWGYPLENGEGILQIGDGGRAGKVIADEIKTGNGRGEILFKHTDADYEFSTRILTTTIVTAETGRTILSGDNSYTGQTTIKENATLVAGHQNAFGAGIVEVEGILEIAADVPTLELKNFVDFMGGGAMALTVVTDPLAAPILNVDGDLEFWIDDESFTFNLSLLEGFDPAEDFEWAFISVTGGIYGFDADAININLAGWSVFQDDNTLVLSYAAIPEPSVGLLIGFGLATAVWRMRRSGILA